MPNAIVGNLPTLPVKDLERSVSFYRDVLGLDVQFVQGSTWATMDTGNGTQIALRYHPGGKPGDITSIGFTVGSKIDELVTDLNTRGVSFFGPILDTGTMKAAFFCDPDGNPLYLAQITAWGVETTAESSAGASEPDFLHYLNVLWLKMADDLVEFAVDVRESLCGPNGILYGGVLLSLVDIVAAACASATRGNRPVLTTSVTLHFLARVTAGQVRAEARVVNSGRLTTLVDVVVSDSEGRKVATALVSFAGESARSAPPSTDRVR